MTPKFIELESHEAVLEKLQELADSCEDWEVISIQRVGPRYEMFYFD